MCADISADKVQIIPSKKISSTRSTNHNW